MTPSSNRRARTPPLDAALALAERVHPGRGRFRVMINNWPGGGKPWAARLYRDGKDARGSTAPLALLAALLRSMIAEQEG